jgi:hypothetical protein
VKEAGGDESGSPTLLGEKTAKCLLVLLVTRGRGCFAKVGDQSIVDTDTARYERMSQTSVCNFASLMLPCYPDGEEISRADKLVESFC